jgi:tripartite-type tricarboxylate transporter receptor subunit TctC
MRFAIAALAILFSAASAASQEFPQRATTLVVGFGAGGGADVNARIFAEVLSRNLNVPVVVENKTGAGGAIAATYVQRATPDGHTLLVMSGLQHAYVAAARSNAQYEPIAGFAPVGTFFDMISVLSIPHSDPANSIAEFIARGRTKPEGVLLGSPGPGSPPHIFGILINEATGLKIETVQYRGSSDFMSDLASGRINFGFPTWGVAQSFITNKKTKAVAVAADKRWSELPDVPTLTEAKIIKEMPAMWFAILAPASTPEAAVAKINAAFKQAATDPDLIRKINASGMEVRVSTPQELRDLMVAEDKKMNAIVDKYNLKQ